MVRRLHLPGGLSPVWVGLSLFLGALAVIEYLASSTVPTARPGVHLAVAVLGCGGLALLPTRPRIAVGVSTGAVFVGAALVETAALFGLGLGLLVLAYGAAHWLDRRALPTALAVVTAAVIVRALRADGYTVVDGGFDVLLVAVATAIGLEMRRRGDRADVLERDLAGAIEAERTRLARELHDIVASSVSVIVVQAGTGRPLAERHSAELAEILHTIEVTGREALIELRRLLGVLRGEPLSRTDPIPGLGDLERLADRLRQAGNDVELSIADLPPMTRGLELCIHRVVQEGLTNALRHAPGADVTVRIHAGATDVTVEIDDSGATAAPSSPIGSGVGLVGLRERVALFGGDLEAGPWETGFRVRAVLPLVEHASAR